MDIIKFILLVTGEYEHGNEISGEKRIHISLLFSMGGALSCAVAGLYPEDIAGIVHLAGLYHYTLPGVSEIIDIYKGFCPRPVKAVIRGTTTIAVRSVSAVLSPVISGLLYLLGSNNKATASAESESENDLLQRQRTLTQQQQSSNDILSYTRQFLTHLRRQPIPFRSALSVALFVRRFVPAYIEKAIMNTVYPSPWVPNSVEDPWGLMKASVESPSIGIYLSIAQMAIHHEFCKSYGFIAYP